MSPPGRLDWRRKLVEGWRGGKYISEVLKWRGRKSHLCNIDTLQDTQTGKGLLKIRMALCFVFFWLIFVMNRHLIHSRANGTLSGLFLISDYCNTSVSLTVHSNLVYERQLWLNHSHYWHFLSIVQLGLLVFQGYSLDKLSKMILGMCSIISFKSQQPLNRPSRKVLKKLQIDMKYAVDF